MKIISLSQTSDPPTTTPTPTRALPALTTTPTWWGDIHHQGDADIGGLLVQLASHWGKRRSRAKGKPRGRRGAARVEVGDVLEWLAQNPLPGNCQPGKKKQGVRGLNYW